MVSTPALGTQVNFPLQKLLSIYCHELRLSIYNSTNLGILDDGNSLPYHINSFSIVHM